MDQICFGAASATLVTRPLRTKKITHTKKSGTANITGYRRPPSLHGLHMHWLPAIPVKIAKREKAN